jgi:hypothetical protein
MEDQEIRRLAKERLEEIKSIKYTALHRDGDDGTRQARLDSIEETNKKIAYLSGK